MTVNPSEPTVARHQRGLYKMPSSITFFWTTGVVFGQPMRLAQLNAVHGPNLLLYCAYDLGSCSSAPKICLLKWQVPKQMIGRRLSQEEAKQLLAKFNRRAAH